MVFQVVEQIEKVRGNEIPVRIKRVKFFPQTDAAGEVSFIPLKMLVLKVVAENDKGAIHSVTWNGNSKRFIWHWPNTMQYPPLRNGDGRLMKDKYGHVYPDTLAAKISTLGEVQRFDTAEEFSIFAKRMGGEKFASEVLDLFANKLAEIGA